MATHIFFKDKNDIWQGPYTEREVLEWYRKRWFDGDFPFFFAPNNGAPPTEDESGISLRALQALNGIGCPFIRREKSDIEVQLELLEEELRELQLKCVDVVILERKIERLEKEVEALAAHSENHETPEQLENPEEESELEPKITKSALKRMKKKASKQNLPRDANDENFDPKDTQKKIILKPQHIDTHFWQKFYKFAELTATFIMDDIAFFDTGILSPSRKELFREISRIADAEQNDWSEHPHRNAVCEHVLVQRMKEKEFFACNACAMLLYTYKQAIMHFTTLQHCQKIQKLTKLGPCNWHRELIGALTSFPKKLVEEDMSVEVNRLETCGLLGSKCSTRLHPTDEFVRYVGATYSSIINKNGGDKVADPWALLIERAKSATGIALMNELHEHLGKGPTHCRACRMKTGDRDGFYAHCRSHGHVMAAQQDGKQNVIRNCWFTHLINVHRRDPMC